LRERRALVVAGAALLAVAAIYLAVRPSSDSPPLSDDPIALARRLRAHPADWHAASALTEHALDARVPNRFALWHAAHDAAMRLAPMREAPRMELVRAALFHWRELSAADRRAALDTLGPLMRDEATFFAMARPIFDLTGNVAFLRRWNPGSERALTLMRDLAAINGHFAEYRALRADVIRQRTIEFRQKLPSLAPPDIIGQLPPPPYSTDDEPLLRDALAELHRRPLIEDPRHSAELDAFVDYALRHHLQPLDGIDSIVQMPGAVSEVTRYRLARLIGNEAAAFDIRIHAKGELAEPRGVWQHLREENCVNGASWVDREMSGPASIAIETVKTDEVPPYVEVYLDDARVAEGEIGKRGTFAVPASAGMHRLRVQVPNLLTRNGAARLVRVVSVVP
jgi:hypothetical protein